MKQASQRITTQDVAKAAGVSVATVSRTINGKIQPETKTAILVNQAIQQLGYVPNRVHNYAPSGPQFGFFGDAWQTIYQSNKACGAIEHDNIDVIKKNSNFRSAPRIVQLLNDIRPDLPQKSAIDAFDGEVVVITCEDYTGTRRTDRNFKGELPPEVLKARLDEIEAKIKRDTPNDESLKILMITHKVLATQ